MKVSSLCWILACAAALLSGACAGRPFVAATPPGFVEFDDRYEDGEYRAATADGVVIGARAFDNEPKGELSFWVKAVQNRLRETGGYALLEAREIQDRGGMKGTLLRFGHDENSTPHLYYLAIFAGEERVYVLEAGGEKTLVERAAPQIEWAFGNFLHR